ncbi:unnamed protein product [Clavelina lepadiformis]|uniref:Uncharacterized protein n=1 Tax=Clavelina lepadiformis TaxID=159417 RepID=A0ABP0GJH7_CLALP
MEGIKPFGKPSYFTEDYKTPARHYSLNDPPSPATSGYSELDSEPDTHDSGRVSGMEDSPKMAHYIRPQCGVAMRTTDPRRCSNTSSESLNRTKGSKRQSRSSKISQPQDGEANVVVDRRVLKALLLYVRETRLRLTENEVKMREMEKKFDTLQKNHDNQMITVVKSISMLKRLSDDKPPPPLVPPPSTSSNISLINCVTASPSSKAGSPSAKETSVSSTDRPRHIDSLVGKKLRVDDQTDAILPSTKEPRDSVKCAEKITTNCALDGNVIQQNDADGESVSARALYAVVKKKPSPMRNSGARYSLRSDDARASSRYPSEQCSESGQKQDNDAQSGAENESVQSEEHSTAATEAVEAETASSSDFSGLDLAIKALTESAEEKSYQKSERMSNTRQFSASSSCDITKPSCDMISRSSGDGFYISDNFRQSQSSVVSKNSLEESIFGTYPFTPENNPKLQQPTPATRKGRSKANMDSKSGVLLTKFKRKLKDTKRKVSRSSSKDSILSSSSVEQVNSEFEVVLRIGKNDSNGVFLPNRMELQHPKSYISYTSALRQNNDHSWRQQLNSTGDDDSRRSTDASDHTNNSHPGMAVKHSTNGRVYRSPVCSTDGLSSRRSTGSSEEIIDPGYSVVRKPTFPKSHSYEIVDLPSNDQRDRPQYRLPLKDRSDEPKRQSSGSTCSSGIRKASSVSSLSSIDEDAVLLPQTVDNELYRTSKTQNYGVYENPGAIGIPQKSEDMPNDDVFVNDVAILDDVTHQQDEMRRFETGMSRDEAPPKILAPVDFCIVIGML